MGLQDCLRIGEQGVRSDTVSDVDLHLCLCRCSVRGADAGNGIRVFIPDIGMFVVSLVTWLLCRSLEKPPLKDVSQHNSDFEVDNQVRKHILQFFSLSLDAKTE